MQSFPSPNKEALWKELSKQRPFVDISKELRLDLFENTYLSKLVPGQTLLRPDELPSYVFLVLKGEMRLLVESINTGRVETLTKCGPGQFLGWSSLFRGGPCEWVTAAEPSVVFCFPANQFIKCAIQNLAFREFYFNLPSLQESHLVACKVLAQNPRRSTSPSDEISSRLANAWATCIVSGDVFKPPTQSPKELVWHVSTNGIPNHPVGSTINEGDVLPIKNNYNLPYRLVGLLPASEINVSKQTIPDAITQYDSDSNIPTNLASLGIVEDDSRQEQERYPILKARGAIAEAIAVCEMISLQQKVPFRRDSIQKVLEEQFRRDKALSLELMGGLCELLGMATHLAEIDTHHSQSMDLPAICMFNHVPVAIFAKRRNNLLIAHPHRGLLKITPSELEQEVGNRFRFATPRRTSSTPMSKFGWGWFVPLLSKYRLALVLVFVSSLLAQLFGLAIPLLIQQIIDKVLSQGNLSSLNILGGTMVILALFQGVLTALRTYIFVDTTDRMDLTLGSSVIDRLLSLPLRFFERRPVGELSQRIGELNTIRSFLTGTALVSLLNIIFAVLYLAVMIVYSPLLTAVALSTLPLYIILVIFVAPIYKSLIRKRAVAQAKTQSHLIEVLNGIQTVKAQHFELTARWKWQDRYRYYVSEGFKSTALGSTSGEIGKFLNTVSGLLVLWVGMWLVLEGELTLGMLIAFRIISGNVTGPLLQLSTLYQGFQSVQLSMERLSDILDQTPELSHADGTYQIPMPPIEGEVRFENVSFRFGRTGPYQVDDVSLHIPAGNFVGIVGQSGSGKSTLTKLLPRLYEPARGRIFIDDYDINKVDLSSLRRQIGIVPQDSLLFEGTISENIALNDPQATTEAILEAARIACAHDFIMSLGQGYATPIAERGGNLSGGQRQRIAIARTVLANPQLLVMDEATSALDFDTERQLCLNLQSWASGRTVLFITHRLSSIKSSDIIFVMHNSRLDEQGTHSDLVSLGGRYASLYRQQGLDF